MSALAKQGNTADHRTLWFFACSDGTDYDQYKLESWDSLAHEYIAQQEQKRWFTPPLAGHPCAVNDKAYEFRLGGTYISTDVEVDSWVRVAQKQSDGGWLEAECKVIIIDWPKSLAATWYFGGGDHRGQLFFWDGSPQAVDPGRDVFHVECEGDTLS